MDGKHNNKIITTATTTTTTFSNNNNSNNKTYSGRADIQRRHIRSTATTTSTKKNNRQPSKRDRQTDRQTDRLHPRSMGGALCSGCTLLIIEAWEYWCCDYNNNRTAAS